MSLEMNTFVESIDDSIVPKWLQAFEALGMHCEIHPEFSFATQTGFLPFKLSLASPAHEEWRGKYYLTGFEFYIDDFDLNAEIERINPRPSGIKKLFGGPIIPRPLVSREVDSRLTHCKKIMSFVWGGADSFELRIASVSAAVLAVLTGGVCSYPADNIWHENEGLAHQMAKDAYEFEARLKSREIKVHEFEKWL